MCPLVHQNPTHKVLSDMSSSSTEEEFGFVCDCCGEWHSGPPSFGYDRPLQYYDVPEPERDDRIDIDSDSCAIDERQFYIRCTLDIPVIGFDEPFCWGVWLSQSETNFHQYRSARGKNNLGVSTFGWLAVTMPGYVGVDKEGRLVQLRAVARWQQEGTRPQVELSISQHQLYLDQKNGISVDRMKHFLSLLPH